MGNGVAVGADRLIMYPSVGLQALAVYPYGNL